MITFICGANTQELEEVAGKTVGEVRSQLADVLNVPNQVRTLVNGQSVEDGHVLQEGDRVELLKPAGEKG